ncbi:translation initiation factor IF-2-like isoform X2 [Sebastes umbrosus]|nr:translation initiation factor IF-2-like isoform X2 [Sebastes umbrosus]
MATEEDSALLFLIFQHLKVNGYEKAAKVLKKHVAQVETPEETSNLHDIYTSWMKLCSLAQHAKQETEDSSTLKKKSIKPEPATSEEEEGEVTKLSNITEENNVDAKPPPGSKTDVVVESSDAELPCEERDAETVSEQLLHPAGETNTTNSDREEEEKKNEEEETKNEQESAPVEVSAKASNEAESSSSHSEEEAEPGPVEPRQAASDQAEDQLAAPNPAATSGDEPKEDDDELKEVTEAATDETSASEQKTEASEEDEEASAAKKPSPAEPTTADLTAQETNDQQTESEAPSPADPDSENPNEEEEEKEEEKSKRTEGSDVTSPLKPEDQTETSTTPDKPIADTGKMTVVAAAEDPEVSIILNIEAEDSKATEQGPANRFLKRLQSPAKMPKLPRRRRKRRAIHQAQIHPP